MPIIPIINRSYKVYDVLKEMGFREPTFEFKKPSQVWSLSFLKGTRRTHIRGFKDKTVTCENETMLPNHFGFLLKPKPCPSNVVEKVKERG